MATRSGIDASILARLQSDDHIFISQAVDLDFDSGNVRVWGGLGDVTVAGETFTGAGDLMSISDIEETGELGSSGVNVGMSGMDSSVLNLALTEDYQHRPMAIFLIFLAAGSNEVVGALKSFQGRMISMSISDNPDSGVSVVIACENRLQDLQRPCNLRYTNSSQDFVSSNTDTAFRYVAQVEDLELVWGKEGASGTAGLSNFTNAGGNKWF